MKQEAVLSTLTIQFPEDVKTFAGTRVGAGQYGTVDEYLTDLVRRDQMSHQQADLEALLLERLKEPGPEPMTEDDWRTLRDQLEERITQNRSGSPSARPTRGPKSSAKPPTSP